MYTYNFILIKKAFRIRRNRQKRLWDLLLCLIKFYVYAFSRRFFSFFFAFGSVFVLSPLRIWFSVSLISTLCAGLNMYRMLVENLDLLTANVNSNRSSPWKYYTEQVFGTVWQCSHVKSYWLNVQSNIWKKRRIFRIP